MRSQEALGSWRCHRHLSFQNGCPSGLSSQDSLQLNLQVHKEKGGGVYTGTNTLRNHDGCDSDERERMQLLINNKSRTTPSTSLSTGDQSLIWPVFLLKFSFPAVVNRNK